MNGAAFLLIAGVMAGSAIGMGAFGAHGLAEVVGEQGLAVWRTASHYHLLQALGLGLVGILGKIQPARSWRWVGAAMFAGSILFSGSLYALVLFEIPRLGVITPVGGVLLMAAWLGFAVVGWRSALRTGNNVP